MTMQGDNSNEAAVVGNVQTLDGEDYVIVLNQQQQPIAVPAPPLDPELASVSATTVTETDIETDIDTVTETETETVAEAEPAAAAATAAAATPNNVPRTITPSGSRRNATPTTTNRRNNNATPTRITYEELSRRPRSNPRSRTPMRYESPMNNDEFRRGSGGARSSPSPERMSSPVVGRRITIRPLAGRMVGTTLPERTHEERRSSYNNEDVPKSRKQGPSHRKVRRWNNENFINLAAELEKTSSSSRRGKVIADTIRKAQADAHLYRDVYDPSHNARSEEETRFMKGEDPKMRDIRDKFFDGELPATTTQKQKLVSNKEEEDYAEGVSGDDLVRRIDGRLRRVIKKSCENSYPACKVVEVFEKFLVRCFSGKKKTTTTAMDDLFKDILLEPPTVSSSPSVPKKESSSSTKSTCTTIQMFFDGETNSETGGFHRLLCHGVCQFHNLKATSSSVDIVVQGKTRSARVLTIKGTSLLGPDHRILKYLLKNDKS